MARRSACSRGRGYAAARLSAAAAIVTTTMVFSGVSHADISSASVTFAGSAAADGVRVTTKASGVPLTDTPVDGGGPTAQVVADSIGTSKGYAALPDPGPLAVAGPGLVAGVLGSGAPAAVPQYPFFVASDPATKPEATFGSTGAQLSAKSQPEASSASAESGLEASGTATVALVRSQATIGPSGGSAGAKAFSTTEGFGTGPLSIGSVTSTATETIDGSGRVTPGATLEISGMRIGGVAVGMNPQGLVAGPGTYPVPVNPTLEGLLKSAGITMQVVGAQTYPDRVVAPALEVTVPSPNGTTTIRLGNATAQMSGSPSGDDTASASSDMTGSDDSAGVGGEPADVAPVPSLGGVGTALPAP